MTMLLMLLACGDETPSEPVVAPTVEVEAPAEEPVEAEVAVEAPTDEVTTPTLDEGPPQLGGAPKLGSPGGMRPLGGGPPRLGGSQLQPGGGLQAPKLDGKKSQ
jgi:hypothetical protein